MNLNLSWSRRWRRRDAASPRRRRLAVRFYASRGCTEEFRDGVCATQVRKRSDSFRSSRFPVEPDPETARYRPERAAADRLWRVLRKRSASGAVDATVVASALRVEDVSQLFGDRDVLHRRDFVDTIAPLLKLSSSAPLRSNARRAAFVDPDVLRYGSAATPNINSDQAAVGFDFACRGKATPNVNSDQAAARPHAARAAVRECPQH